METGDIEPLFVSEVREFYKEWRDILHHGLGSTRQTELQDLIKKTFEPFKGLTMTPQIKSQLTAKLTATIHDFASRHPDVKVKNISLGNSGSQVQLQADLMLAYYNADVYTKLHPHLQNQLTQGLQGAECVRVSKGERVWRRDELIDLNPDTSPFRNVPRAQGNDLDRLGMSLAGTQRFDGESDADFRERIRNYLHRGS